MKIFKFNEAKLDIEALQADAPGGKGTRGDVLVDKLKKQAGNSTDPSSIIKFDTFATKTVSDPVDNADEILDNITDGEDKTFDFERAKNYFAKIMKSPRYYPRFKVKQNIFKLNDIEKTKDFGSSGGSSLGTDATITVESIQCLYLALRQKLGRSIEVVDLDLLFDNAGEIEPELAKYIRVPKHLDREKVETFHNVWYQTLISTANSLYENRPLYTEKSSRVLKNVEEKENKFYYQILDSNKKYIFYQINFKTELIQYLRAKYKSFENCKNIAIEKWNPSDIWAVEVSSVSSTNAQILNCPDIYKLSKLVDRKFKNRSLVGISLKKVQDLATPTLLINKVTPRPTYQFLKVRTSKDPFSSLGIKILLRQNSSLASECRDIMIDLRTFGGSRIQDVSGEILGTSARHGKIALYWINYILAKFENEMDINVDPVESFSQLTKVSDEFLYQEIVDLHNYVTEEGDKISDSEPEENLPKRVRLISKYQALKVGAILYDIDFIDKEFQNYYDEKFSDRLCQEMMYYALAIKNDVFEAPMYVRVI